MKMMAMRQAKHSSVNLVMKATRADRSKAATNTRMRVVQSPIHTRNGRKSQELSLGGHVTRHNL